MRGSETIKEMQERHPGFDGGQMGNASQVHDFLNRVGRQHGKSGLAGSHDVGMVPKNAQGMGGQGSGRNVEYGRQQFPCHFIHIGNH